MNPHWQKSSYWSKGDSCVHISTSHGAIHLTESADSHGVILDARPPAFSALIAVLKKESPRG
jgi:hypothetical protein